MANFDIQEARGSVPGRTGEVLANIDTRTGNQELAAASADLAGATIDMSLTMWKLQADTELTDAVAADQEALNEFSNRMKGNPDTHTYHAEFTKVMGGITGREIKNGLAARGHRKYIATMTPRWNEDVTAMKEAKTTDIAYAKLIEEEQRAEETGNIAPVIRMINSLVSAGRMSHEEAAIRLGKTINATEYEQGTRIATAEPEAFLASLKNGKSEMMEGFPTVNNDRGKMLAMKNLALGSIADIERGAARLTITQTARIKQAAVDPDINAKVYEEKIRQSDGLTPEQKITAMNLFVRSRNTMARGGGNAYTKTENWELYSRYRERAAKGTITEQEIMDSVGPGGISWPEAERLLKVISGESSSSKAFEESAAAENLTAQIKAMLPVTGGADREDVALNQFATQKGLGLLEDAIQNNPDWTDREKKEEALRIGRRLETELDDGTLERGMENAIEMTTEQRAFVKMDLTPSNFTGGVPRPKTKAEYDALPVGATYIHPTLGRVVKR